MAKEISRREKHETTSQYMGHTWFMTELTFPEGIDFDKRTRSKILKHSPGGRLRGQPSGAGITSTHEDTNITLYFPDGRIDQFWYITNRSGEEGRRKLHRRVVGALKLVYHGQNRRRK